MKEKVHLIQVTQNSTHVQNLLYSPLDIRIVCFIVQNVLILIKTTIFVFNGIL